MAGLTQPERLLYLNDNNITDISAVSGLTNLIRLSLSRTSISDISPLVGLTNLRLLYLSHNNITDISAVSGLTNLADLYLDGNDITDISVVSGLTNLRILLFRGNSISDLSPLVASVGLGSDDFVVVSENPLNRASIKTHIPALQNRGVTVGFDNVSVKVVEPVKRSRSEPPRRDFEQSIGGHHYHCGYGNFAPP